MLKDKYGILVRPLITEKHQAQSEEFPKYAFEVRKDANKIEIKRAVEQMFPVKVKSVQTATLHGKNKRVGKHTGFTGNWKKAYVTLSEGEINFADEL
mgnify:CR=1 FL=1